MSWSEPREVRGLDKPVSRLCLSASYGIDAASVEWGFERGINSYYWGSIRTGAFREGLRNLIRAGHRDRMVIALQSYVRWPAGMLGWSVERGLCQLGIDHADILILGWYNKRPPQRILDAALHIKERGLVRSLMMSGHNRSYFPEMAREGIMDLFMVRYNAAHRRAEEQIFEPLKNEESRPGIWAYTATRWGTLLDRRLWPEGESPIDGADCYRFALTHPMVDVVLCGPRDRAQYEEALQALERGPLDEGELARMHRIGDSVYAGGGLRSLVTPP